MRVVFLFALLPFVGGAQADSVASIGFEGLDRHLFDPAACYDKIAETGVKRARIQSGWCLCEPAKGVYDFSELDAVVSNLTVRGIEPWMMVGFGNTNWMGACHSPAAVGCVPLYYGPECRAAWERFVAKLAARYAKQVRHWEIWNEPDIGHFWRPRQPSAADYAELVKLTGAIIRREAPGAKIGGVCSTVLNAWLREAVKLAANDVDFWCVHAYGICPERTRGVQRDPNGKVMDYCDQIAELKSLFAAAGRPQVEIWQGEAGFPSWFKKDHWLLGRNPEGYGCEEWQAKWLLRRFLTDRRAGCACSSFYAAADICRSYSMATTTQTHPAEHGLLASRRGYARKASHRAFSVYNATLAEAKFVGSRTDGDVIVDEYDAAGRRLIAYYRPDDIRGNRPETVWTNGVSLVPSGGFLTDLLTGAVSARPRELPLRDYPLLWSAQPPFRSPRLFLEDKGRNEPRPYPWRGLMLDESRFFFGKQVVKETLDRMADCGLNVFHWHLTDDQGWRLEIKGCPELTTVGAFRKSSPKVHTEADPDGKPYGPFFYTEADVRDVVAYASARGIRVVPEIELPGHIGALLTARPEFSCRGEVSPDQICSMAIYEDVLCVGNDAAIRYLERVLDEVCRLFPDEVVHIGGDECPTARWEACPKCRARMKAAGIGKVRGLQSWVTHHFARYLQKKGKRAMGWDEILEGDGCPSNVIVQTWREPDPRRDGGREPAAVRAARLGHDVVLSPLKTLYFSLPAGPDDPGEYRKPVASYAKGFGYVTPEKVRAFCPTKGFPPELTGRILGAECCCWSEGTRTGPILHQKTWPRAAIFAATLTNAGVECED